MAETPYSLGPVDDPRLLSNRRGELATLLATVSPEQGDGGHALIIGEDRSGRTTTLNEAGRRAEADRERLVVDLRLVDGDLTTSGLARALLTATAERLVDGRKTLPDWYLAWCDRVHLRDQSPMTVRDVLVSSLAFAADSAAVIDPSVLRRDLRALRRIAIDAGYQSIIVSIDDADPLLEDNILTERLLQALNSAGGWTVLMAAGMPGASHLVEAVSPCLRELRTVSLIPFFSPDQIRACLTAPLDDDAINRLLPTNDYPLLVDILRWTAGNPFEIALLARKMWITCRMGEQEHYELTPRVLERVLPDLATYTGAGEEILHATRAVLDLPPEQIGPALDLIALSRLTTRQIAVARALGLPNKEESINERLLTLDLDKEESRVVEDLEELERAGVIAVTDGGRFRVQGGRTAALALKYQARSLLGPEAADKPFEIPFLACVGSPLASDCARRASDLIPGARRLARLALHSPTSTGAGARMRAALDARPFSGLDEGLMPFDEQSMNRMRDLLIERADLTIGVVHLAVSADDKDLDLVEVWEVPSEVGSHGIHQALSDVLEHWQRLVTAAGLTWRGSHAVTIRGDAARRALIQLEPGAATAAVTQLFREWWLDHQSRGLDRAVEVAKESLDAMRDHRAPDWKRGWENSGMLSRLGFLLSLNDGRLEEARARLLQAGECGPADGWVTRWNLANVAARLGEHAEAIDHLDGIEERVADWTGEAYVLFFVPGRAASDSLLTVTGAGGSALFALQRAIIVGVAEARPAHGLESLDELAQHPDEHVRTAVEWVRAGQRGGAEVQELESK